MRSIRRALTKKPRLEPSVRHSVGNTFSTIDIPVGTSRDLTVFLEQAKSEIRGTIENELVERKAMKFYLTVILELERISTEGGEVTSALYLHSLPSVVLESSDLEEQFQTASDRLKDLLDVFQGEGSGFSLKSILECTVNVASYDVIGGSLFIELPVYIKNKKATVKIKNTDEFFVQSFLYILSYVRKPPVTKEPNQPYHYKKDLQNFNVDGLKFPLPVKQIPKFENQNGDFSVNVYSVDLEKEKSRENQVNLYPVYTSPHRNRKHHVNLQLIKSEQKSHYVVIKSLSRLLYGRTAENNKAFVCKFCLYAFKQEHSPIAHEVACSEHPSQKVVYPTLRENILRFENFGNSSETPFCIYADFESLLVPNDYGKKLNKHEPSGVAVLTVSAFPEYNTERIFVYSGPGTMDRFFEHLGKKRQRINSILSVNVSMTPLTFVEQKEYADAKTCKNCGTEFDDGMFLKVNHHLHTTGQYLFACCNRCNLLSKYKQSSRKSKNNPAEFEIPVVFHNMSNYDLHLILQHMPKMDRKNKASCIATSSERLITFSYRGLKFH